MRFRSFASRALMLPLLLGLAWSMAFGTAHGFTVCAPEGLDITAAPSDTPAESASPGVGDPSTPGETANTPAPGQTPTAGTETTAAPIATSDVPVGGLPTPGPRSSGPLYILIGVLIVGGGLIGLYLYNRREE